MFQYFQFQRLNTPLQSPGDPVQQFYSQNAPPDGDFQPLPQCSTSIPNRLDCFPESMHPEPEACKARGCCWDDSTIKTGAPVCYLSQNTDGYKVVSISPLKQGNSTVGLNATLKRTSTSPFPKDIMLLQLLVFYETRYRVRFKVSSKQRICCCFDVATTFNSLDLEDVSWVFFNTEM